MSGQKPSRRGMLQWCAKSSIIKSWLSENAVHAAEFGLLLIGQLWRLATQLSLWPRDGHAFTTSQVGRKADPDPSVTGRQEASGSCRLNVWCATISPSMARRPPPGTIGEPRPRQSALSVTISSIFWIVWRRSPRLNGPKFVPTGSTDDHPRLTLSIMRVFSIYGNRSPIPRRRRPAPRRAAARTAARAALVAR